MGVLTKEEKKAKKEAKRLAKIAAELEAQKRQKRLELEREITAQSSNRAAVDKAWREIMLKIKEPLFRKDIEVMWHCFERLYDKKDHLITLNIKLMDVADDQFQRTIASFCDIVDNMINKFLIDLEDLSKDNDRRTKELLKQGEDEADHIMSDHNAAETHLQLLIYHAHTTADTLMWNKRGENMVKEDEDRLKYGSERESLRSYLEHTYNVIWDSYKSVLREYVVGTAENQKQVRKLRRKENLMADIIASQGKKIANSDGLLRRLRNELAAYESGTKQAIFRDRRNRHRAACFRLKQSLIEACELDAKKLDKLVSKSDAAVEWLAAAHKKGEKILRLAALCRKFETQREKVLPFGSDMPHSPTRTKTVSGIRRQTTTEDNLVTNAISSTCGLTRLWQRISKAELVRRALLREKQLLEQENEFITKKLQGSEEEEIAPEVKYCMCSFETSNSKNSNSDPSIKRPVGVEGVSKMKK